MNFMLMASIGSFLNSMQKSLGNYGSIIVSIIGIAMVIVGIYQVAKNLISHGKGQTSWVTAIALIIIGGGIALTGGWRMIGNFANTGRQTLDQYAQGNADTNNGLSDPFNYGTT